MVRTEDPGVNGTNWSSGWNDGMERESVGAGQLSPEQRKTVQAPPHGRVAPPRVFSCVFWYCLGMAELEFLQPRLPETLQIYTGYSDVAIEFNLETFLTIIINL